MSGPMPDGWLVVSKRRERQNEAGTVHYACGPVRQSVEEAREDAALAGGAERWRALAGRQHQVLQRADSYLSLAVHRPLQWSGNAEARGCANVVIGDLRVLLADPDGAAALAELTALHELRDAWRECRRRLDIPGDWTERMPEVIAALRRVRAADDALRALEGAGGAR